MGEDKIDWKLFDAAMAKYVAAETLTEEERKAGVDIMDLIV